jgi:hypothetical protein
MHTGFRAGVLGQRMVLFVVWLQDHFLMVVVHILIRDCVKEGFVGTCFDGGAVWFSR